MSQISLILSVLIKWLIPAVAPEPRNKRASFSLHPVTLFIIALASFQEWVVCLAVLELRVWVFA